MFNDIFQLSNLLEPDYGLWVCWKSGRCLKLLLTVLGILDARNGSVLDHRLVLTPLLGLAYYYY